MPILKNPKHERFAQELAKGKAADEAYQLAGFKPNRGNACTLKQNQSILERVDDLLKEREAIHAQATAQAVETAGLTKGWVIETLMENVRRAMQAQAAKDENGMVVGDYKYEGSVANRSLELLGKELGMFIDRKEIGSPGEFDSMNADELRDYIARTAQELGIGFAEAAALGGARKPRSKLN